MLYKIRTVQICDDRSGRRLPSGPARRLLSPCVAALALLLARSPHPATAGEIRPSAASSGNSPLQAKPGGPSRPGPAGKVVHVVEPGQTLFGIARAYGVPLAALIEGNRLKSPNAITPGQRLTVPGAAAPVSVPPRRPLTEAQRRDLLRSLAEAREPAELPQGWAPPPPSGPGEFIWPLQGPLNSPFGARGRRWHAGIDVGSPRAQQVGAAADGEVSFAQATRTGFGNVVVLDHAGGFTTLYAHLAIIIAREGESVRQGQPVGGVGASGNATGPHLHFEIRHRGAPLDPLRYLPQTLDDLMKDLAGRGR